MRTYARQGKRVADVMLDDEGREVCRKRIRMDSKGMVVIEGGDVDDEGLGVDGCGGSGSKGEGSTSCRIEGSSSIEARVTSHESSSTAPSSPPPSDSALFSDPRTLEQEGTSPPSSPPPPLALIPSPPPPTRKPAFTFLKRKRSSHDHNLSEAGSQPLSDIAHNMVREPQPATAKRPRLTQMQIDLGGEVRRTCDVCEMEYIPSNKGDVAVHKSFHDSHLHGVELGKAFVKDGTLKRLRSTRGMLEVHQDIVVVDRRSSDKAKRKAKKVLEVVNTDLSAPAIDDEHLWGALESSSAVPKRRNLKKRKAKKEAPDTTGDRFKVFMYLVNGRCAGFCLAEKINLAFRVVDPHASFGKISTSTSTSSSISVSSDTDVALLGISRIWTSKSFRLQNIAVDLLDCARSNFFYGMELTKDLVAFSQPTESGGRLAKRWFEANTGWHVYTEGH